MGLDVSACVAFVTNFPCKKQEILLIIIFLVYQRFLVPHTIPFHLPPRINDYIQAGLQYSLQ